MPILGVMSNGTFNMFGQRGCLVKLFVLRKRSGAVLLSLHAYYCISTTRWANGSPPIHGCKVLVH